MIQRAIRHFQFVVVGGGAGGICVASRILKALPDAELAIIEPSEKHYYQPLWTLVGGGASKKEATVRNQLDVIPSGAKWLRDSVTEFAPEANQLRTRDGETITYDYLVVSAGIQLDWKAVDGLDGNVGQNGICSNYSYETVDSTWEAIQAFEGGTALFTHPNTPIKCGGAPQKIMYLAADYWRKHPPKNDFKIVFCMGPDKIFAVDRYADGLLKVIERYGIEVRYEQDLHSVHADEKVAVLKDLETGELVETPYSMLHVTPPMSAPDFIKNSPLAAASGWLDVNKFSLQHVRYSNVFGLGDASSLPTSKTGAAVRKQAPVVASNILAAIRGDLKQRSYDGYTSCPLVTGYGKLILAEFDYDQNPRESFPVDQSKERLSMYVMKKHLLPQLYWNGMLKGRC